MGWINALIIPINAHSFWLLNRLLECLLLRFQGSKNGVCFRISNVQSESLNVAARQISGLLMG